MFFLPLSLLESIEPFPTTTSAGLLQNRFAIEDVGDSLSSEFLLRSVEGLVAETNRWVKWVGTKHFMRYRVEAEERKKRKKN